MALLTVIGRGVRVRGRVTGDADLTIEGHVEGEVDVTGEVTVETGGLLGASASSSCEEPFAVTSPRERPCASKTEPVSWGTFARRASRSQRGRWCAASFRRGASRRRSLARRPQPSRRLPWPHAAPRRPHRLRDRLRSLRRAPRPRQPRRVRHRCPCPARSRLAPSPSRYRMPRRKARPLRWCPPSRRGRRQP